jgi:hypothetical protein
MLFHERGLWVVVNIIHEESTEGAEYSNVMLTPIDETALKWCLHLMTSQEGT